MAQDIAEVQLREAEDKEAAMMKAVRLLYAPCFVARRALAHSRSRLTLCLFLSTCSGVWRWRAALHIEPETQWPVFNGRRKWM